MVVEASAEGDPLAREIFHHGLQTLGWRWPKPLRSCAAVIVAGGGVPLAGETLFFEPLRREVARYVLPPLATSYRIVRPVLGEEVVVYGGAGHRNEA